MRKRNTINTFFILLFITCLIIFLNSFLNIIKWDKENRKTLEKSNELQNMVNISEVNDNQVNTILISSDDEKDDSNYWYYAKMNLMNVNIDNLFNQNNDVVGWINVPGTNIDYPFVQANDNKFYLNHSFDKKYNDAGWIFLDYRNDINNLSKNNIIYGHARIDKTMFGSLRNTLKKEWFNNIDNRIVKISTPKQNTLWQVFSIYHIKTEPYYITVNFNNENDFQKYIDKSLKRSVYNFNVNINTSDTILTLSTCYGENEKLVLHAKLIKKEIKNP
ncbi:MAG: class B sortase [Bacilli bacterium]|nr:class B sortase [Bacilli bacterium]